jgi:predicted acyltransferase
MSFSFTRRLEAGGTRGALVRHVLQRSLVLFTLGMILTGIPDFDYSHKLILDVLQRIAVVYLVSALIVITTRTAVQATLAFLFLVIYWLLMTLVPVPGHGRGVLDPTGNVWQYVDSLLLRGWHFHGEGILSLIPSFSTVLLGTLTGEWLRSNRSLEERCLMLFVAGNAGLVLGLVLDPFFPINKLLWSSSYVIFTAGFALNVLGICFWAIEIMEYRRWATPLVVFGVNPIAAFFFSSLTARLLGLIKVSAGADQISVSLKSYLFSSLFESWLPPMDASLLYALCYTLLWLAIMTVLYRKKIIIKI